MQQESLNNRLEKLEKEIYDLVKLQEQKCADCLHPMQNQHRVKVQRVQSGTIAAKEITTKLKSCSKTKSESRSSSPNGNEFAGMHKDRNVKFTIPGKCPNSSSSPYRCPTYTEGNVKQKLNVEKEKVEQAHKIIEDLKEDLSYSKARMCTMAKDMALLTDALQSVRNKYKNIKVFRKDAIAQIEQLKNVNAELCRKLEYEMKNHAEQIKKVREQETQKADFKIKQETGKLLDQNEKAFQKIQMCNEKLKNDIIEINNKYAEALNDVENLKRELNARVQNLTTQHQETDDLKALLRNERSKNAIINKTIDRLEKTVADLMKVEKKAQCEIMELKQQVEQLENMRNQQRQEIMNKDREYDKLDNECQRLKKQVNELAQEDTIKCKKIEKEMEKLMRQMKDREGAIIDEKNTLKTLVQELSEVVKKHKTRIRELVHINRQQEGLLKNQMIVLRNKEHQVEMSEVEVEAARSKNEHLQDQIEKLKVSLKTFEKMALIEKEKGNETQNKVQFVVQELEATKAALEEHQDKLLIKEKIIDDQADTIQKLKNNLNCHCMELKRHTAEIQKLQKELENEKYDKEQLQQNIEDITWHKQQLKNQIAELEDALRNSSQCPAKKMDHQNKLLSSLEHQVSMKQKEWELRCKVLNTEKKRAVQAAKFATQKLVDTVNDFQTQAESQKQVQAMLTNMVQNKNRELKTACKKISDVHELINKQREPGTPRGTPICSSRCPKNYPKSRGFVQSKKF